MSVEHYGVVDIGGTKIVVGIADVHYNLLLTQRLSTDAVNGPDDITLRVANTIRTLMRELNLSHELGGIGISVPGPLNRAAGIIHFTGNLRWHNYPLAKRLSDLLNGVPVYIDDDGNCAGAGEAHFGAGKGYKDQVFLAIGTGIGGAVIIDGQVCHGTQDLAGEVGHMTVIPDGPSCPCGNNGCLEAVASGTALARLGKQAQMQGRSEFLSRYEDVRSETVLEGARHGDDACLQIVQQVSRYLGITLANLVHILNPAAFVLGGGVMEQADLFLPQIVEEMNRHLFSVQRPHIAVKAAVLGDKSGLWGALQLVLDRATQQKEVNEPV